jgi:transposase
MRPIRAAIGATTINPELLTCAERLQYEGYLRREETIATILALAKGGAAIKQIVRKTGHSRNRVRQVIRGVQDTANFARYTSAAARCPMGWRLSEQRQTLATAQIRLLTKDIAAVHAALVQPWSNGQTEGQITKLKLVKRQMYGRAKIDLLQARLIGAT